MEFATYIARRYLRSRRLSRFLGRGSVTAIVGIAIGVMVLNITLAVMNGFNAEMTRSFVENMPMVSVHTTNPEGFTSVGAAMDSISVDPEIVGVAPFIHQEVLITSTRKIGPPRPQSGVVWGIEPDLVDTVLPMRDHLLPNAEVLGSLDRPGIPRVILGVDLANTLYAAIGDTVILTSVNGELDLNNIDAVSREFVVTGFIDTGMPEFDGRFVYIKLDAAREFLGYLPGGVTMLGVKVADLMRADRVADRIEDIMGYKYWATDWMALNATLFQWIKIEKKVMILLLGMIILIAGFNIIGILTMMVGERRREIGILLAMGAKRSQIMGIFLINGVWLGAVGIFFGSLAGIAGIVFLDQYGLNLPGDVYFVEKIPVLFQWTDFVMIALGTLLMALAAGWWPSWEASNLKPMEIIRYT